MKKSTKKFAIFIAIFLFGAIFGSIGFEMVENEQVLGLDMSVRRPGVFLDKDRFTNPLLDCADMTNFSDGRVEKVKRKVAALIDAQKMSGTLSESGVYFRDLNNGPWFSIDASLKFYPASLLKVPLMMAIYRQGEGHPEFLDQSVKVGQDNFDEIESYKASSSLRKGDVRTIRDILGFMVKYSDNNAVVILNRAVDRKVLEGTYSELGIGIPDDPAYQITVRNYASFFRVLYNATYLNQHYSEEALKLLSESDFNDGLVAGLPSGTKISHKFGERDIGDGKKQLHDCGIIYQGTNPYLLCVMTRGRDNVNLASLIAKISKTVYDGLQE
jgi:beta-lactamase class A